MKEKKEVAFFWFFFLKGLGTFLAKELETQFLKSNCDIAECKIPSSNKGKVTRESERNRKERKRGKS